MNGVINLIKPPAMTSNNVVGAIKKCLNQKKVGHAGTLDPAASGVLPIFLGKATKLFDYLIEGEKEYIGEITFGRATDTQDAQGVVIAQNDRVLRPEEAKQAIEGMMSYQKQVPPAYSAIKYQGKKLYELARKGQTVELPKRPISVYQAQYLDQLGENRYLFKVNCSKGTYIRTLCHDAGADTGVYAHLSFLLRTKTGQFTIEDGYTLDEIREMHARGDFSFLLPMDAVLGHYPSFQIDELGKQKMIYGQEIPRSCILQSSAKEEKLARIYGPQGEFLALGCYHENTVKIQKMLLEVPR